MLLADALALSEQLVISRDQHCYYSRVTELSQTYRALITGEDCGLLLKRFVRREDEEAFEQRLALTISITPAVCAALMKPFAKIMRNNKVRKNFDFKTDQRNDIVKKMRDGFYGRKNSQNKGFDYWLKVRYPILSFVDPNAWVVIEWKTPDTAADIIQPYPLEVSSVNAWNWSVINEEVKWLWAHTDITYRKLKKTSEQSRKQARELGEYTDVAGERFVLYDQDNTITYTQIDPDYMASIKYVKAKGEDFWQHSTTKVWYSRRQYLPKLGYVPAFRVGYVSDTITDGKTFVNGFHDAMPYLMKSVKTVSEMDLTMSLHAFPQKLQYVQKCPGESMVKRCNGGSVSGGGQCKKCSGTGFLFHTTAQDALFFNMPEEGTLNNELLDLDKLLVYKTPPIDLLTFQRDYIESLKRDSSYAVFGATSITKTQGPQTSATITATEANDNIQGVHDAIFPFAEKWSDVWVFSIYTFGRLSGVKPSEDPTITCVVPNDLKIKTIDQLLVDLKNANDSGAPSFLIDQINNDIAEIQNEGDVMADKMYKVRRRFFPFNGQTPDEIAMNVANQYVSEYSKVLYANFEAIFADIDQDNVGFWFLSFEEQAVIVEKMVNQYMAELAMSSNPGLLLGTGGDTPTSDTAEPIDMQPGDMAPLDINTVA